MAFKTSKCLFLGYSHFQKGYKCLHPTGRIYIARSVSFNETSFPYQSLFTSSSSLNAPHIPATTSSCVSSALCSTPLSSKQQLGSSPSPISTHAYNIPCISVPFCSPSVSDVSSNSILSGNNHVHPDSVLELKPAMPPSIHSAHPMQTKSKSGIFKPKLFTTECLQEPPTASIALIIPHWKQAMEAEYNALVQNITWKLIPSSDASRIVQCKWVFRTKLKADGSLDKYKARLVAKGFQQIPGIDFSETFSLVVKASTIGIVFTLAMSRGWNIQQKTLTMPFLMDAFKKKSS